MDELLRKFVEGTCSEEEFKSVTEMLRAEIIPSDAMRWMRQHWYVLKKNNPVADGTIDFESVLDKIHHDINIQESQINKTRFLKIKTTYRWIQFAAAFVFISLSVYGIWKAVEKGIFRSDLVYTVSSVRGQSSKVCMPDGSELWLNGESSVTYASSYGIKNRKLILKGEGFFSVAKNADIPFVVEAGATHVTAIGTAFNVDADKDDANVIVTMESGRVLIESHNQQTEITSGQQAHITESEIGITNVDYELYTSWRNGQIVFKDETLFTITTQLEKMYDVKFVYKSDTLKSFRYRGTIRLDNSVFKALEMLKLSTGIIYKVEGSEVILEK